LEFTYGEVHASEQANGQVRKIECDGVNTPEHERRRMAGVGDLDSTVW